MKLISDGFAEYISANFGCGTVSDPQYLENCSYVTLKWSVYDTVE